MHLYRARVFFSMTMLLIWNLLSFPLEAIYLHRVYADFSGIIANEGMTAVTFVCRVEAKSASPLGWICPQSRWRRKTSPPHCKGMSCTAIERQLVWSPILVKDMGSGDETRLDAASSRVISETFLKDSEDNCCQRMEEHVHRLPSAPEGKLLLLGHFTPHGLCAESDRISGTRYTLQCLLYVPLVLFSAWFRSDLT